MLQIPGLYIGDSEGRGRGVFCAHDIEVEDVIEVCPLVVIPEVELPDVDKTIFYDYYFLMPNEKDACIALGYGSLYNHSETPNAAVYFELDGEGFLRIECTEPIKAGQEIFINYQGDDPDLVPPELWFEVV
jgi:uncharacterized protein